MKQKVLLSANAAMGAIIICLSIFGLVQSTNVSDRYSALLPLGCGVLFCLVSYGLWIRSRLLVSLGSIPVIVVSVAASIILLFAPFAWGDSNIGTVYILQFISLSSAVLQVTSLRTVFAPDKNRNGNEDTQQLRGVDAI